MSDPKSSIAVESVPPTHQLPVIDSLNTGSFANEPVIQSIQSGPDSDPVVSNTMGANPEPKSKHSVDPVSDPSSRPTTTGVEQTDGTVGTTKTNGTVGTAGTTGTAGTGTATDTETLDTPKKPSFFKKITMSIKRLLRPVSK